LDGLRLHLGCGSVYKPGYVNVDSSRNSNADIIATASRLPFLSESADTIEAYHLLEHFDLVHCRYVLSEWFRVLRPEGSLTVETPDLRKSAKKLASRKPHAQRTTLQWMFGIDSPGFQHKTAFTDELISHVLKEVGYEGIRNRRPKTHLYEPGLRIECRRPQSAARSLFMIGLRGKLIQELAIDDSYVMVPLEKHLEDLRMMIPRDGRVNAELADHMIARSSACHPALGVALLEELASRGDTAPNDLGPRLRLLTGLVAAELHKRAFTLWAKSKKNGNVTKEFEAFSDRLERALLEALKNPRKKPANLDYIMSLEATDIPLLDIDLVLMEGKKALNRGVRDFHEGRHREARDAMLSALAINPDIVLAYWNLARLGIALGRDRSESIEFYTKAARLAPNARLREKIKKESELASSVAERAHVEPISEHDLADL